MLSIIAIPVVGTWFYASNFFIWIGSDTQACAVMQIFIVIRAYSVPADIVWLSYEKYLMSVGLMTPSFITAFFYNVLLVITAHVFVTVFSGGVAGLAWALTICNYLKAICLVAVSIRHPLVRRTFHWYYHNETCQTLWEFFYFGISGCIMICAEWWAYVSIMSTDM